MASNVKTPSVKMSLEGHDARKHTRRGMETRSGGNDGTPSSGHSSRYHIIKTIGKGNFAKVKLAKHILTGQEVAIKIIDKTHMNPTSLQKLRREVRIMKLLDHPNIVKLYEVIETEKSLNLVMEYASRGELFDYLVANGRMKEKDARVLFRQIISAIQYCHQKRILHRDLKAENLLLDEDLNVKIADFGFSNEFSLNSKLDTFCGSPPYAAPELFQGKKYDGPEVDVWSLGVILYTLVSGSLPFDGQNLKELRERVLRGKYRIPFYMTTDCENLLKKFLILNPIKRATLETIMKDLWLNTGYDDNKMKPFNPPPVTTDSRIIDKMVLLGLKRRDVEESLIQKAYNHLMATYLLLCRQSALARTAATAAGGSSSCGGGGGGDDEMAALVSKTSSVLRATSVSEHKNNNSSVKNNNINHPPLLTQPHKPPTTTTTDQSPSTKVSRSVSAAASNFDKRITRKDTHDNFPGIQKTPLELQLNAITSTTATTATTPTTPTNTTDHALLPTALHYSINVPQIKSSNPTSNHNASNFCRATTTRTTLPPSSFQSSEHITPHTNTTPNNSTLLNQSLLQDSQFTTPSISRSVRKSFLHRISSKFYRNKSNRKSEGMVKSNNKNNHRLTQQQQQQLTTTPTTTTTTTSNNNKDLNSSLAYMNTPSLKHSNDTFTSIATNSTTTTTTEKATKPRALHFTWHLRNTSASEADKMITQIRQVLDVNHCDYYQTTPFVVHCSHCSARHNDQVASAAKGGSEVEWVMEVCRLPRLSMNGVKFKRVSGSPLIYKNILTKVSNELQF